MFQRFNAQAREAMERATRKARALGHVYVEPGHIIQSLAEDGESSFHSLLDGLGVDRAELRDAPLPPPEAPLQPEEAPVFSPDTRRILAYTVEEADALGHKRVGTSHFLLGLVRTAIEGGREGAPLAAIGISLDDVRSRVRELADDEAGPRDVVPSILFYELDRRARDAEADLARHVEALDQENQQLKGLLNLLTDRLARLEGRLAKLERRR